MAIVLGPTGSGKSDLAIHIAQALGGEIINCDSLQLYRGFDIGTAKVPEKERRGIPHHLIDILDPGELFTAGDYARVAREALLAIAGRQKLPVVVGGTGLYLRALLEGLSPAPARDAAIRARLVLREKKRPGSLHRILSRLDTSAAVRIHRNDVKKIIRALEVHMLEKKPLSALFEQGRAPLRGFQPVKLGLNPPRELLYQRLDARTAEIFRLGLIDEVRRLRASGVPGSAKPFESLGYKQALQVLDGSMTGEQAVQSTQLETRRYAKRQVTWFRREPRVHWFAGFGDDAPVRIEALAILERAGTHPAPKQNVKEL